MKNVALSSVMIAVAAAAIGAVVLWPEARQDTPAVEEDLSSPRANAEAAMDAPAADDPSALRDLTGDEGSENDALPLSIEGHRSWTRVNDEPYDANPGVAYLCRRPPPVKCEGAAKRIVPDAKHRDRATATKLIVYVNDLGRKAMMTEHDPHFPVGSILVKEKWFDPSSDEQPQLMTVMRKREPGYSPDCGDWEFATFAGDGVTLTSQGRHASCMRCHTHRPETDFVFRSYLFGRDTVADVDRSEGVFGAGR